MKHVAKLPDESVNFERKGHLRWFVRLLLGVTVVSAIAYFSLGFVAEQIALQISPQTEKELLGGLGGAVCQTDDRDSADAYLQGIIEKLTAHLPDGDPYGIEVRLLCSLEINAVAYPGGFITMLSPLYDILETENEVAYVLAHEIGHVIHRDSIRTLGRTVVPLVLSGLLGFAGDGVNWGSMSSSSFEMGALQYSRSQEDGADQLGLHLLNKAYGHVGGAVEAFQKMDAKKTPASDWTPEIASTHPDMPGRVAALVRLIEHHGYTEQEQLPLKVAHSCTEFETSDP